MDDKLNIKKISSDKSQLMEDIFDEDLEETKKKPIVEDSEKEKKTESAFGVHKMPKNYKIGHFDDHNSIISKIDKRGRISKHSKKIGIFIVIFGVIFVLLLVYLVYSYISTPDFSLSRALRLDKENSVKINYNYKKEDIIKDVFDGEEKVENEIEETETEGETDDSTSLEDDSLVEEPVEENLYFFVDSDNDGLSDEEEFILETSHLNSDSDGDGYGDLAELLGLYDPASTEKLINNINIAEYKNNSFSYSVLHPKIWIKSILSDESSAIFSIDNHSFVQILVEENTDNLDIKSWYANRFFSLVNDSNLIKKATWEGFYSDDGSVFYLADLNSKNIYTILYSFPENQPQSYINIFKMMVNSFSIK